MTGWTDAALTVRDIENIVYVAKGSRPFPAPRCFGPRRYHGLIYQVEGNAAYVVDGGSPLRLSAGAVLYLPQGRPYYVEEGTYGDCIAVNFYLDADPGLPPLLFFPRSASVWQDVFTTMDKRWLHQKPGYRARCMGLLYQLLAMVQEREAERYVPPARLESLRRAISLMEESLGDPALTVDALAMACDLRPAAFRALFRQAYGMPPKAYLLHVRMRRAMDLLRYGDASVGQIAEETGFASVYHFSKAFKHATGQSPSAYRAEWSG